jgi:cell shape-determining protein MreD
MDYLYILFAIPVAAFTIAGYSKLIADIRGINQGRPLIAIRILSGFVLALIALELALVFTVGKVESRFLTIPKEYGPERWKYSLVPCTFLAFVLLIMQLFETDLLDGV